MFGLRSPLTNSLSASEFDNVSKIFSQSSFTEPVYQTSPYLEKANEDGELFCVEVDRAVIKDTDSDVTGDLWGDNQSVNSRFPCSNSEDTGYSSDTDLQPAPKTEKSPKKINKFSRLLKKKEVRLFNESNIDDSIDSSNCDCADCKTVTMTNVKDVLLFVDPNSKRHARGDEGCVTQSICEHVLGIIPGYHGQQLSYNGVQEPVYIKALSPDGPAIKVKDVRIGDWLKCINGHEVTRNNLDILLSTISSTCKVRITLQSMPALQSICRPRPLTSDTDPLFSMVTGDDVDEEGCVSNGSYVLYTSLEGVQSDNSKDKDDLVYHYPDNEGLLLAMRGMFYTLCHTVKDFTHTSIQTSCIVIEGEVYNICYHMEGKDLLVFAVSQKRISSYLLNVLKDELVRLLQVLFGSVDSAFKNNKHHKQLNHILGVIFRCQLDTDINKFSSINRLLCHTPHVQYLPLPSDIMLNLSNILSEFEAGDFVDMSDSYYGLRRSYSILGSCLFYKDYLLCSHLNKEHLFDIRLYLQYHGLLSLTSRCPLNQLVIWREVYPTQFCNDVSGINNVFGYSEPDARWFLLIVGLKYSIYAVLLEAGGCSVRRQGATLPDPFYIDQAKSTLLQTLTLNYTSIIESRLNGSGLPTVINVDNVHQKARSLSDISFPLSKSGYKKQDDSDLPPRYPQVTSPRQDILQRKSSIDSDASSGSSSDSLFKSSRTSRLFGDMHNPVTNNRWLDDSSYKLSQGADNCVFNFCCMDSIEGIYISNVQRPAVVSVNQTNLMDNFHRCCCQLRKMFHDSKVLKKLATGEKEPLFYPDDNLVDVKEHGVLFTCQPVTMTPDSKKHKQSFTYWVVGRKITRGNKKEMYVCFLDSTPQNVIEMAFTLGFSKTCF
ncbi:hypothetical protein SNE40_016396 [Patella caerulea]|uniref:Protein inturned n=1 Tax=Patella caerulea TaxID=87958 RepID=A0AAN8PIX7_PATCE